MDFLKMIQWYTRRTSLSWFRYPMAGIAAWSLVVALSLSWNIVRERHQIRELVNNIAHTAFDTDLAFRQQSAMVRVMLLSHILTWMGGMLGIGLGGRRTWQRRLERISDAEVLTGKHQLLQTLIDSTPDHIYMKDTQHHFIIANQAMLHSLGATHLEDLADKTDRDFHAPERAEQFWQEENDIIRSGNSLINREANVVDSETGTLRWLLSNKIPVRDAQGNIFGIMGFNRDITERKRMEEALRESEEFLNTIIENIPNMIFVKDAEQLRFVRYNKAGETLLGYSRDELIGKSDYDFFPKHEADFFVAKDRDVLKRGVLLDIPEEHIHTKKLGERILHTKKIPIPDKDGKPMYLLGISEDITEHKLVEKELQQYREHLEVLVRERTVELAEERRLLRILIDSMPDLILIKDIESRFMAVNPALARLMGAANPGDLLDTTDFDWYPRDIAQQFYEVERTILESGDPSLNQEELHIDPETDEERWFLATKIPFRDQQGVIRGLVGISRDITEHKHLEEELRRHRDHLEEIIKERTAELTAANEHLRQEIAERTRAEDGIRILNAELEQRVYERTTEFETANRELKDFAYVVSHDLKAPLRAIGRLADWLVADYGEAFDANGQEMIALLIGRVKRLDGLIDGILEYSRIGRIVGQAEPIDLNRLLADIIDLLAPPSAIRIDIAPELPVIVGDSIRIQQVFANLIGNAVKFMDKPRGVIRVAYADAGEWWQFSITDNGPGIEPQHYERIFKIFQTLKPRDELESTGIGLTIVKKIIEGYGGRIEVESEIEKGSTFFFTLPKKPRASGERMTHGLCC